MFHNELKVYGTLIGDQLMEFKFSVRIKNSDKAYDWCLEHYGEEGIRWNWDVSEDFEYDVWFFKTEQDLVWFMLNCGVEIEK